MVIFACKKGLASLYFNRPISMESSFKKAGDDKDISVCKSILVSNSFLMWALNIFSSLFRLLSSLLMLLCSSLACDCARDILAAICTGVGYSFLILLSSASNLRSDFFSTFMSAGGRMDFRLSEELLILSESTLKLDNAPIKFSEE